MERFIVGTGRCGSTLLSNMLGLNPKILSLSEFWSIFDRDAIFKDGSFDGGEVIALLERSNLLNDFVTSRNAFLDASSGHAYRKEVSAISRRGFGLPALQLFVGKNFPEDEMLYEASKKFFYSQPRQSLADHWRDYFDWLRARSGRDAWIERSGVSIEQVATLIDWYPSARIVHLHRDGPTNAIGIRSFRHFVLYASFFLDPPNEDELQAALTCNIGSDADPIMRRMRDGIPSLAEFGNYWSWQVTRGTLALAQLPAQQRLDVRYEDLVGDTRHALARIADFFELPAAGDWIERAAAEIDPEGVPDRLSNLDAVERRLLDNACLPGQVALGRSNSNPYAETMQRVRAVATRLKTSGEK